MTATSVPGVGVVAIGRNEGDRLRACLESVVSQVERVVYVDSGSTDGSVALAERLGVEVVELDDTAPFTAARARAAGLARLLERGPALDYVQFVDGDCEVVDGWLAAALGFLERDPRAAIACGRRRERFPGASFYNRLADVEWDGPAGEVASCGGDSMARVGALREVGGFDPAVAAGEEPELCWRLRKAEWTVHRLPVEMTVHDIAMHRFGQWWRRQVRFGRASLQVSKLCEGPGAPYVRQVRSARLWTAGWLVATAVAVAVGWWFGGAAGVAIAAALALLAPVAQAIRIAARNRSRLGGLRVAIGYGSLMMLSKWAEAAGQVNYVLDHASGRRTRLIEYKTAP